MRNKQLALKRVKEIAEVAFAERGFDKVTVGEIAALAHCSTATIYQAYGSKSELHFEVRRDKAQSVYIPMPQKASGPKSLQSLLVYAQERIYSVSGIRDIQNYRPIKHIEQKKLRPIARDLIRRATPLPALEPVVKEAMKAGLLRRSDIESVAYVIWTGTGWETAMLSLLFGADAIVDPVPIIRRVFTPLVTRKGHAEMSAVLNSFAKTAAHTRSVSATLLEPDLLP